MRRLRILRRLAIAIALAGPMGAASAASYSTDQSDLWWVATESGWGIQFVQRGSTIFATMFVYDAAGAPTWYTATLSASGMTWSGDLYATRGPWFGTTPFDPGTVTRTVVGTLAWTPADVNAGTLTYSANSTRVSKSLQRQPIVVDSFAGDFFGAIHQTTTGCVNAAQNTVTNVVFEIALTQASGSVAMASLENGANFCTYSGTLTQAGQMGSVSSTYSCADGTSGTLVFTELQVNPSGMTGRVVRHATASGCTSTGWFGGGRVLSP